MINTTLQQEETVKKYSIAIIESWLSSQQSPSEPILEALELRFGADAALTLQTRTGCN